MEFTPSRSSHLPLLLQNLQLLLVRLLSQCLVDFCHDRNFLASIADGRVVLGLWQVSHETQHRDPHC